jgi:MFS family permease
MPLAAAVRYVLRLRTNVLLIVSSALGYFFQAGVNTFGVVFVIAHFGVSQSAATSLLALAAGGAVLGTISGGRLADALLARGHLSARMVVGGSSFLIACAIFVPGLLSKALALSMVLYFLAAAALSAPGPALDAARLDIVPGGLWGRAEAIRTVLRTLAIAAAPLVFGFVSDELSSGPRTTTKGLGYHASGPGLKYTFLLMLIPMAAGGLVLLRGARSYPRDVATALASEQSIRGTPGSAC